MIGDRGRPDSGNGAETFERWYLAHNRRLVSQCRRMLGDAAAAEDIAQETLLRAWLGRERMREEDVGAWLSVVARNLCVSHLRRQKKQIPTEVLPEIPDELADPAHVVARLESRRAVRRAMRGMGERHRRLLQLREIDGVDYEELGAELGLTAGGTRTVLFRARRVLRDRLAAVGEGFGSFLLGVRIRLRTYSKNLASTAEPVASPFLQAGLALVLSGSLAVGPAASLASTAPVKSFAGYGARGLARALSTDPLSSEPRIGARVERTSGPREGKDPNVRPGFNRNGDWAPTVPGPKGHGRKIEIIRWENNPDSPYPWEGSRTYDATILVVDVACDRVPALCDEG